MDSLRELSANPNSVSETNIVNRKTSFGCFKELNSNANARFRTNFRVNPLNPSVSAEANLFRNISSNLDDKSLLNTKKIKLRKINTFVNLASIINSDTFLDEEIGDFPNPKLSKFHTIFQCKRQICFNIFFLFLKK